MRQWKLLLATATAAAALRAPVLPGPNRQVARAPTGQPGVVALPHSASRLRGGAPTMSAALAGSGLLGVPACWAIATVPCCLAYVRQAYVFSLGYGLAIAAIGASVLSAVPSTATLLRWHALLVVGYGVRLFAFLLWRQIGQDSGWGEKIAALDKQPRLQRTPVIASTALFYALLTSPLLFHLQSPSSGIVAAAGVTVAAVGLAVESIADQHKSLFKIKQRAAGSEARPPTGGLYAWSRHPNYLGEHRTTAN